MIGKPTAYSRTLDYVRRHGPVTSTQIASALAITRSTASRYIKRLCNAGAIELVDTRIYPKEYKCAQ